MSNHLTINAVQNLSALPPDAYSAKGGFYTIKSSQESNSSAYDDQIRSEVWFRTPALNSDTIERIHSVQLFAESHDQGFADEPSAGNWTWFELAIFEDENAQSPRVKEAVKLQWTSHENRFLTADFGWANGTVFGRKHELFGFLEPGNIIGVLTCARFPGWEISAREGFLVFELGKRLGDRPAIDLKPLVENVNTIQEIIDEANAQLPVAFLPAPATSILRAEAFHFTQQRPLRVLSLDGGGVRGLSSLYILREIMKKTAPNKKPCEIFDMIAGTSTGGLIAIMLGCLKLSVEDCITEYESFARKIFTSGLFGKKGHFVKNGEFYDSSVLEEVIKDVIGRHSNGNSDVKLLDEKEGSCKVFVVAVRSDAANNREPVLLRSYRNPEKISLLPDALMWEAGRATSAAPVYFHPIQVGKYELVDGGLGANNPLGWVWNEVLDVFGAARNTDCFLSIGTGIPQNHAVGEAGIINNQEIAEGLAAAATNSQLTHILFKTLINAYAPKPGNKKYWRLNIGEEIKEYDEVVKAKWWNRLWTSDKIVKHLDNYKDVGELDDVGKINMIRDMTTQYIAAQRGLIDGAVASLSASL